MALQENIVTQNSKIVERNLRIFQESCKSAQTLDVSKSNSPVNKKSSHSYEAADAVSDELSISLMKETWNIKSDE